MPTGQFAYLGLVFFAFAAFIGGLLFVCLYSRKERAAATDRIFAAGRASHGHTRRNATDASLKKAA